MARYALIRNGVVTNVAEWDGDPSTWAPPAGATAIQSDTANIGDSWDGTTFNPPAAQPADPEPARVQQAIAQLKATFNTARTAAQINNSIDALTILMRQAWKDLK